MNESNWFLIEKMSLTLVCYNIELKIEFLKGKLMECLNIDKVLEFDEKTLLVTYRLMRIPCRQNFSDALKTRSSGSCLAFFRGI